MGTNMIPNISWPSSPPNTPPGSPRTPRSNFSVESLAPVYVNNQAIYPPESLKADVRNAADRIRSNWVNALKLEKRLILNPDILIPLLNHAKLYWYTWLADQPVGGKATQRLESVFVNNINLSQEESDWVEETIRDYKNNIESALYQKIVIKKEYLK